MSKHTVGPWFVGARLDNDELAVIGDGDSVVCEFRDRAGGSVDADARLIAAAPELLAALRDVIGWVPGAAHFYTEAPARAVERARKAIAKATGQ